MTEEDIENTHDDGLRSIYPELSLSPSLPLDIRSVRVQTAPGDKVLLNYLSNGSFGISGTEHNEREDEYEDVHDDDNKQHFNERDDDSYEIKRSSVLYERELKSQHPDSESAGAVASHSASPHSNPLVALPLEVQLLIAQLLEPEEVFDLALSCKDLRVLIKMNHAPSILHKTRPFSREALTASYSSDRALRTYIKRSAAIRAGRPFWVACIGLGFEFIYANGAVCYTPSHTDLRFLDLDQAGNPATSFDISASLLQIPDSPDMSHHHVRPLHYADGYISFVYSCRDTTTRNRIHRLVVLDRSDRKVITSLVLQTYRDVCVRNNQDWLYCGLVDEEDQWSLHQFYFHTKEWTVHNIPLAHMSRGVIGVSNCFEIFDDFLYAASSELRLDDLSDSTDSFYYICRFLLGEPRQSQVMAKPYCMRRQTAKGVVDDRWSSLQLNRDEVSGDIYLYESLREKRDSQSNYRRYCYRMKLLFTELPRNAFPGQSTKPEDWQPDWEGFHPDTHHDDWSDSYIRSPPLNTYVPACRTFLDIVPSEPDDKSSTNTNMMQIRARPLSAQNIEVTRSVDGGDNGVYTWPSEQRETNSLLRRILQPFRRLQGYSDDSFMVFAGQPDDAQARKREINIIAFDPSVRIATIEINTHRG